VYQREQFSDALYSELRPIITEQYEKICHFKHAPLNPNLAVYKKSDEAGYLRFYTARNDEGELCGYATFFVIGNLHQMDSKRASHDSIYVLKSKRGFGHQFIRWMDEQLKAEGIDVVFHSVNALHDFSHILKRLGYEKVETIYSRRLQ